MNALELTFTLETPTCLSSTPAQGNEVQTLRYIPGGVVRGMLANAYLRRKQKADGQFRDLFSESGLQFGNLLPLSAEVLPLSAYTCKRAPGFTNERLPDGTWAHGVFNLLFESLDGGQHQCSKCDHALTPLKADFYTAATGNDFHSLHLSVTIHMRTSVGHGGGAREGFLFAQEELAAGTRFRGLALGGPELFAALQQALGLETDPVLIVFTGRRRSGKGKLELQVDTLPKEDKEVFFSWGQRPGVWAALKLASDLILVDRLLRPITVLDEDILHEHFGLPASQEVRIEKAYVAWRRVSGWSGVGKIFRPDDIALVAGSSFLLHFPGGKTAELQEWHARLEKEGVGLRRAEGFGRVTFRDPLHLASFTNQHGSKAR